MDMNDFPHTDQTAEPATDLLTVIADAADSIRSVDDTPLEQHAEQYQAVHASLQHALSDTDLRDSG